MKLPLRAIIWAAVSTNPQASEDKHSIPSQLADAHADATEHGWHVVDEITVPGHSRYYDTIAECAVDMRAAGIDAFDRLSAHWEARDADVVIVRDADRFARTLSMGAEFVSKCYRAGMTIYSRADGHLPNERQALTWIAGAGLRAQHNVMFLVDQRKKAAPKLAQKGFYINGEIPDSHEYIRDPLGRRIGVKVNEAMRVLLTDAANLLLEGVSFDNIESEIYKRFGHGLGSKPYSRSRIHKYLNNPYIWGHTANHIKPNAQRKGFYAPPGPWVFDEGEPIPEGVVIAYNTHEPVFTGDFAQQLKDDLRRRFHKRNREGQVSAWVSRLFVCAECGHLMHMQSGMDYRLRKDGSQPRTRRGVYLKCYTRWKPERMAVSPCTQAIAIRVEAAQEWVSRWLRTLRDAAPNTPSTPAEQDVDKNINRLQDAVERVQRTLNRLIIQRAEAPEGTDKTYYEQIQAKGRELASAQKQLEQATAKAAAAQRRTLAVTLSIDTIRSMQIEDFWAQTDVTINRQLRAILGDLRFAVIDGQIIGFRPAPMDNRYKK